MPLILRSIGGCPKVALLFNPLTISVVGRPPQS